MANEITLSSTLRLVNGNLGYDRKVVNLQISQSTARLSSTVQTIGTSAEQIAIGSDVSPLGVGWVRNLDTTNYVQIGIQVSAAFYPVLRLKPGEGYPLRLEPGVSYYAKANTASVDLEFAVLND